MIEYRLLKKFVLEVIKKTPELQFAHIQHGVENLVAQNKSFPSREESAKAGVDHSYYQRGRLNPVDILNISQIVWDLIVDRVLTVGVDTSNMEWPFLRITEFGKETINQAILPYYDAEGYDKILEDISPKIDPVVKQYAIEGLNCFQHRLYFASAVMFGAAAEKAMLLLLEMMANAESQSPKRKKLLALLERPNLPEIFSVIQTVLGELIDKKVIPYSVHQGSTEHLLSLFEMIRVHRNDSVHPAVAQINKTKAFLTIQTLPGAIEIVYHLIGWFEANKI